MSLFIPTIPQANDNLDFSQGQLLSNNSGLDTVFGIDHYKFSDATANKGFHNQASTPAYVEVPPTGLPPVSTATLTKFYAFQITVPLGLLQFSRGYNSAAAAPAVPTPITALQSPVAPITLVIGNTTNILDFTGISTVINCSLIYSAQTPAAIQDNGEILITWTPALGMSRNVVAGSDLQVVMSGNILQLKNNGGVTFSNIFWTLKFHRIQ